jgi:ribosomal protein L37AE/L43A
MMTRLRDTGLNGMKASVEYCKECRKQTVHYTATGGWPVCHACGYNAELEKLSSVLEHRQAERSRKRWPWDK